MEIAHLIAHPECLDRSTLYELRELVAINPYFHAARVLFLQNLFLLHDPSFDEELRRAALLIPDRSVLFDIVEGRNYEIRPVKSEEPADEPELISDGDRTASLIDTFLRKSVPQTPTLSARRRSTADPSTDYMAYLMQMEDTENETKVLPDAQQQATKAENDRTTSLIDEFMDNHPDKIVLPDTPEHPDDSDALPESDAEMQTDESFFTETLAKIYIKQGHYDRALDIISRINLNNPKKSIYFADQIRFLKKLSINNKYK